MEKSVDLEKVWVKHKFLNHIIDPEARILIIGTFNPCAERNEADFFYGGVKNYLWTLLPRAYGGADLKNSDKTRKLIFIRSKHIDFIDLISEVKVDRGQELNRKDAYIDKQEIEWRDIIGETKKLANLKLAVFTRKTSTGIPKITKQVKSIEEYLSTKHVKLKWLVSPARYYSDKKQKVWTEFFSPIGERQ